MIRLKLALFFSLAVCGFAPGQSPDANGDPLPSHALARLGTVRWRHGAAISFVTQTPDGKHLLTDSADGTLRLWDLENGKEVRRFAKPDQRDNRPLPGFLTLLRTTAFGTALSPNGRIIAAGSPEGTITLWDLTTGQTLHTLKPGKPTATAGLTFSADSQLLLSKDSSQIIRLWDVQKGTELRKFGKEPELRIRGFAIGVFTGTPVFLSGGDVVGSVEVDFQGGLVTRLNRWDLVTGRELPKVLISEGGNEFLAFGFSPDGKVLATAGFQGAGRLVDTATGKELHKLAGLNMLSFISQYAFSTDGKMLAGWCADQTIHLWDTTNGKEIRVLGKPTGPQFMGMFFFGGQTASNLQFTPDSKYLIVGTSGSTLHRIEVETGKKLPSPAGHQAGVLTLAISPDGKTILTRGADDSVYVWDSSTGKEIRHFVVPGDATQAAFTPDGQTLATGGTDGMLRTWNVQTGKEIQKWQGGGQTGFNALAYSADGKLLASRGTDRVIRVWDPATGKEKRQIGEKPEGNQQNGNAFFQSLFTANAPGLIFSPDGTTVATMPPVQDARLAAFQGGMMNNVKPSPLHLWDVGTGRLVRKFDETKAGFTAFAYSPDGRALATAGKDGSLVLWEAIAGKVRLQLHEGGSVPVEVQPFGLPGGFPAEEKPVKPGAKPTLFTALAFSPNNRLLVGAGNDRIIRLWDAVSGQKIGELTGHDGKIETLRFTADSSRLISGSADTTALVWDLTSLVKNHRTRFPSLEDGRVDGLWQALAGDDSVRVYLAALRLIGSPKTVVPVLKERVRPVEPPDPDQLARMLNDLESKQFAVRQKAADDLEKLGELAADPVQKALEAKPSLERQQRLERVRDRLVAVATISPVQRQALRAIEVLERIGTPEAREVLRSLTSGAPGARLTREAQAALDRLGR